MKAKFQNLLYITTLLGLAACANDTTINDPSISENTSDENEYIAVRIRISDESNSTRAPYDYPEEFHPGHSLTGYNVSEYNMAGNPNAHRIFIFNEDNTFYGSGLLEPVSTAEPGHSDADHSEDEADYAGKEILYSRLVKPNKSAGQIKPAKLLAVVNGKPERLSYLVAYLADNNNKDAYSTALQWVSRQPSQYSYSDGERDEAAFYKFGENETSFLTMSSATYELNGNISHGCDNFDENSLQPTPELAKENPVTVFVERINAKVSVGFNGTEFRNDPNASYQFTDILLPISDGVEKEVNYQTDFPGIKQKAEWQVYATNWAVNATEPHTFLFKNVTSKGNALSTATAADWHVTPLTDTYDWNDPTLHRSYWAVDQHYTAGSGYLFNIINSDGDDRSAHIYPTQYRRSYSANSSRYGDEETPMEDVMENGQQPSLDYIAYSSLLNEDRAYSKYMLENTFAYDADLRTGQNIYRVATHLIFGCQLYIEGLDGEAGTPGSSVANNKVSTKFLAAETYWNEMGYMKFAVYSLVNSLPYGGGDVTVRNIFTNEDITLHSDNGLLYNADGKVITSEDSWNTDFIYGPAYVDGGDGWVTIMPKEMEGKNFTKEDAENDTEIYIIENNITRRLSVGELMSLIYAYCEPAQCFKNGYMYYAIPIEHHKSLTSGADLANEDIIPTYEAGDYGVVRNHWYHINIKGVTRPGIPVSDPDQPIIPNEEPTERYLNFQVVVIPWHLVDDPNIIL